jgi:pentatricopeptide repeat protein
MDNIFIQALVQAGSCKKHAKHISTFNQIIPLASKHHKARRRSAVSDGRRENQSASPKSRPFKPLKKLSELAKSELKALVDYYGSDILTADPDKKFEIPDDENAKIWNVQDEHRAQPVPEPKYKQLIVQLEDMLQDERTPPDDIFELYKLLPFPGVVYLNMGTIRDMLHHLSVVEVKDERSMQRYLSVLDDMKIANIHISSGEWTSAIAFAGQFMRKISADEVESALHIWKEMEQKAGIKGTHVTFHVLFYVALRAEKYSLAEMFLKEMETRKLSFHRHFRTSVIYYWGVRQNGNKVREAYQDLVQAGDIVDTVVMNAVIAALIRAGEPAAAEHVFHRMKRLYAEKTRPNTQPTDWREARKLGLRLTKAGQRYRLYGETDHRSELQDLASIAPDSRTYSLIIRHYAVGAGNIDRVLELLSEMKSNNIPLHGSIFVVLFQGFASFGGVRYSSWTLYHLERFWAQYLELVQFQMMRSQLGPGNQLDDELRLYFSPTAVIAALRAFKKVGSPERTIRAWQEVRRVWEPTREEVDEVVMALNRLVPDRPLFSQWM